MLTVLIHDVDVLRFVCGEIDVIQAIASSAGRGLPITDTAAVALRFASGAVGTITLSDTAAAPWAWDITAGENPAFGRTDENCYLLTGSDGSLAVPGLAVVARPGRGQGRLAPRPGAGAPAVVPADPYARQLAHFRAVIRGESARPGRRAGRHPHPGRHPGGRGGGGDRTPGRARSPAGPRRPGPAAGDRDPIRAGRSR